MGLPTIPNQPGLLVYKKTSSSTQWLVKDNCIKAKFTEPQSETWVINENPIPTFNSEIYAEYSLSYGDYEQCIWFTTGEYIDKTSATSWYGEGYVNINSFNYLIKRKSDGQWGIYNLDRQRFTPTNNRTITFETAPTGELLTWLQANAVKQ